MVIDYVDLNGFGFWADENCAKKIEDEISQIVALCRLSETRCDIENRDFGRFTEIEFKIVSKTIGFVSFVFICIMNENNKVVLKSIDFNYSLMLKKMIDDFISENKDIVVLDLKNKIETTCHEQTFNLLRKIKEFICF